MITRPIVIAYHLMWTAYGWWLPNDPRGSTSRRIVTDIIAELGELHYGRKKAQPASGEIHEFYERAETVLKFPLLTIDAAERPEIGKSFEEAISTNRYTCYACSIMPDHIHILIRKHRHRAEDMIDNLKKAGRLRLRGCGLRQADHPVWTTGGWKVFLDHPDEIRRTIKYIQDNPLKTGLPRQVWGFVKEYDGWPFHTGSSPNSPYVKRLQGKAQ